MTDAPFKDRMDYIRRLFAPEDATLRALREGVADNISIYPEEGRLLQLLMRLCDARKVVEIGTFNGYSTHWLAQALPEGGHIWTLEKDAARAGQARRHLQGLPVTLIEGDAMHGLSQIEAAGPFDLVFVDADKLNYAHYLDWAEIHVRKGGLIVGDNTFLFDAVWRDDPVERVRETARQSMRDFNLRLSDARKYTSIMLPTAEGMTIALKNF